MTIKNAITAKTKILAIIGDPVEHSMSPKMHNTVIQDLNLDYVYTAFHVLPKNLKKAVNGFRALNIKGVNVTIPHKVEIMKYLDEIEPTAKALGAINTIKNENGYLKARNTDGPGALKAVKDQGFDPKGKNAVMLGAGGAARSISFYFLKELKKLTIVNRDEDFELAVNLKTRLDEIYDKPIEVLKTSETQKVKTEIDEASLLLNTTPVGMHPHEGKSPIEADLLHSNLFVFDAIYNPIKTQLILDAEEKGCKTQSGIEMLVNQGWLAFKWWTGKEPDANLMRKAVIEHLGIE